MNDKKMNVGTLIIYGITNAAIVGIYWWDITKESRKEKKLAKRRKEGLVVEGNLVVNITNPNSMEVKEEEA